MNVEDTDYSNDTKFRNFVSQVDRCLKGFESSSEWADLITNLGRLIKLLQANAKYPYIPRKHLIGKRLSQCLHPALPAGVHLKALECYDVIFRNIGPKRLADDLFIYCNGLFPLLSPSAISVKTPLFSLFESHFIPLQRAIKPAFVGLLQGLLPGLEEGAEFYKSANSLLEKFCESVDPIYFYTCLWHVMLQAPSIRIYGTTFLIQHYNRRLSTEDQLFLFGNNITLMLNSLAHLLSDSQVLVQRQALDFVLLALSMHRSQLTVFDREKLCAACLVVLLRRDMSLNRRFYSWLMGSNLDKVTLVKLTKENVDYNSSISDTEADLQLSYFKKYSRSILISSLRLTIKHPANLVGERNSSIKPFRIIMTIMDRAEIGGDIIEDILFDYIVFMEKEYFVIGKQQNVTFDALIGRSRDSVSDISKGKGGLQEEFLKTANLFFANLDGGFLWNFLGQLFVNSLSFEVTPSQINNDNTSVDRICEIMKFILKRLPIETYSDIYSIHLPVLLSSLTQLLIKFTPSLGINSIKNVLQIYRIIFDQIIQNASLYIDKEASQNVTAHFPKQSLSNASSSPGQNVSNVMKETIFNYREFFRIFSINKLGLQNDQIEKCANSLFIDNLRKLKNIETLKPNSISLNFAVDEITVEVYHIICQLIVEMTSYPILSNSSNSEFSCFTEDESKEIVYKVENQSIAQWILCLVLSACFIDDFNIKSEAMSTIIDLIYSTRSVYGVKNSNTGKNYIHMKRHVLFKGRLLSSLSDQKSLNLDSISNSDERENFSVSSVVFPVLTPEIVKKIDLSKYFQIAGLSLWDYLSSECPQYHQITINLINRLHQAASSGSICEELILRKLLSDNVEECMDSHRRFILLWQLLAKHENAITTSRPLRSFGNLRNFDKCMLVLLDGLDQTGDTVSGHDVLRTLCHTWLEQSFREGYSDKILIPLLLNLLKPDTVRISLQSLVSLSASRKSKCQFSEDVLQAEQKALSTDEKRIYAISNENGNVKYHLKPKSSEDVSKKQDIANNDSITNINRTHNNINTPEQKDLTAIESRETMEPVIENMEDVITNVVTESHVSDYSDSVSYLDDRSNICESEIEDNYLCEDIAEEVKEDVADESIINLANQISFYMHPLHNHFLIYCSVYDSNSVLYTLSRLKSILKLMPGLAVSVLENLVPSDNVKNMRSGNLNCGKIFEILARHTSALRGNNFYQNPTMDEIGCFRNFNYIEIILQLCTWFMCSYYPVLDSGVKVAESDIVENKKVQLLSAEIIDTIVQEMLSILQIGYVNYKGDFVSQSKTTDEIKNIFRTTYERCNIPALSLHCMATSITRPDSETGILSDVVVFHNECKLDQRVRDTAQITLMRLLLNVLKLDYGLNSKYVLSSMVKLKETATVSSRILGSKAVLTEVKLPLPQVLKSLFCACYTSSSTYIAVSRQSILLTSIVACLGATKLRHLHSYCYQFVISSLGVWGQSTTAVLMAVLRKLCKNVKAAAEIYGIYSKDRYFPCENKSCDKCENNTILMDYAVTTLDCLKAVCHFLLLDEALKSYQIQEEKGSSSDSSLFSSLFNRSKESTKENVMSPGAHIIEARQNMLRLMPKVLDSLLNLWESVSVSELNHYDLERVPPSWTMGKPEKIYHIILSLIKPLLQQHPVTILISLARVWPQLDQFMLKNANFANPSLIHKLCFNESLMSNSEFNQDQYRTLCLLAFARGWKSSFPMDKIINTCREILRKSLPSNTVCSINGRKMTEKEEYHVKVNLLEFLQCYLVSQTGDKLMNVVSSLFALIRECTTNVSSGGSFVLLKIISDFLTKVQIPEDKKEQRELQELCHKVLENVAIIAGSSLEQPTWFRRVAQVKIEEDPKDNNYDVTQPNKDDDEIGEIKTLNELNGEQSAISNNDQNADGTPKFSYAGIDFRGSRSSMAALNQSENSYKMTAVSIRHTPSSRVLTVQAIQLMTLHLASILDVIYKSEEKERVQPFLNNSILPNILPYLKVRSHANLLNLRAASQLMASLSSYQHTRRSWRKEIFDLLFESYFFQFDLESLKAWKSIIDNLMTQDKSTFKEAFTKLTVNQGSGLNIFISKEAEYDQTAVCLKKLAFIILSSETDQYVKSLPEIQERLSDSFRLGVIPQIQTQLFLCFRVILFRMSPQHLTSLWHIYLPALITIFQSLIEDLSCDHNSIRFSEINRRLPMYLSACKLLDIVLLMKEDNIPQFLYYKWAFVGNLDERSNDEDKKNEFCPTFQPIVNTIIDSYMQHCTSFNIPMDSIEVNSEDLSSERPLLHLNSIQSLLDLAKFFFTISLRNDFSYEARAMFYGISLSYRSNIDFNRDDGANRNFIFENVVMENLESEFIETINKS